MSKAEPWEQWKSAWQPHVLRLRAGPDDAGGAARAGIRCRCDGGAAGPGRGIGRLVRVLVTYLDDVAVLDVADDGRGFDPRTRAGGIGLAAMRERAETLGGRLTVESALGEGTTIAVTAPAQTAGDLAGTP